MQPLLFDASALRPFRLNLLPFVNLKFYSSKSDLLLNVINESMSPMIKIIIQERSNFFAVINEYISPIYSLISGKEADISVVYKKCSEIENVNSELEKSRDKDYYYHYTTFGPHHDDYSFYMDGYELTSIASQGQKRMVLIAFKFALLK